MSKSINEFEFSKNSISKEDTEKVEINFESIKEENSKYTQTLDSIEAEAAKASSRIVSGENILFADMKVSERNMMVGFIGLFSEITKFLYNPGETLVEFDSMLEKHVYKNAIVLVGALKTSFLMSRNYGFMNTSEIINWMSLEMLDTISEICKKIDEKWPRPTKEDYSKEDFDLEKWPRPSIKECFIFAHESEEGKTLCNKFRNALHGYTNSIYSELKKNIYDSTWALDIFNKVEPEDILNKIELVKNIEHQYIDWIFDEKIKEATFEVVKSSINLFELLELGGVSLKKFLSLKKSSN